MKKNMIFVLLTFIAVLSACTSSEEINPQKKVPPVDSKKQNVTTKNQTTPEKSQKETVQQENVQQETVQPEMGKRSGITKNQKTPEKSQKENLQQENVQPEMKNQNDQQKTCFHEFESLGMERIATDEKKIEVIAAIFCKKCSLIRTKILYFDRQHDQKT
jgi:outer membrane biosynthesis protein TonB